MDGVANSVDLNTTATHEFGHSHGLSHSMDNQISATDGHGATMFPFIDTGDPDAEKGQRTLSTVDIAWSSYFYPEGTAASGLPALQPGDIAFNKAFGLITGEATHGVQNRPLAGASLAAYNWDTGELVSSGYSGTTRVAVQLATNQAFLSGDPNHDIVDGKYTIPIPKGSYSVGIEAVDGTPAAAGNISTTCQIGAAYGQLNFNEEFYNNNNEATRELRLGQRKNVPVPQAGRVASGINITTGDSININNFDTRNSVGFTGSPAGRLYAVQIPASQISAINPGGDILIQAAAFDTNVRDASTSALFARAVLTTGVINPDTSATINLATPLQDTTGFLAQDDDFGLFYFQEPHDLGRTVRDGINNGSITNLFMVLQTPTSLPFPGFSNLPPVIGLDTVAPFRGRSYISDNGGATWTRVNTFDFRFSLIVSHPVNP